MEFLAKQRGVSLSTYNALECIRMRMEWVKEYRRLLDAMSEEEASDMFDVRNLLDDVGVWAQAIAG